jgi:glycosylphosphatidylinositol transamidase (GPIT) subunit GPI8
MKKDCAEAYNHAVEEYMELLKKEFPKNKPMSKYKLNETLNVRGFLPIIKYYV